MEKTMQIRGPVYYLSAGILISVLIITSIIITKILFKSSIIKNVFGIFLYPFVFMFLMFFLAIKKLDEIYTIGYFLLIFSFFFAFKRKGMIDISPQVKQDCNKVMKYSAVIFIALLILRSIIN